LGGLNGRDVICVRIYYPNGKTLLSQKSSYYRNPKGWLNGSKLFA
jgi:hypothetical protein